MALPAHAGDSLDAPASSLDVIQVSATRFHDPVQEVPNSITVITGEDLAARGVHDLRGALSQLGGVTVGPGGEDGTAGSSLGLLGRRETDDFLLVIDGVPAGGAFTPQFATLNLHNVERIEVIRGTAPVYYGTTAFAGTISIIHYEAGKAPFAMSLSAGSFGSLDAAAGGVLGTGAVRQTLSMDATRDRFADPRSGYWRVHGLYRAAAEIGDGSAHLDLDFTDLHDRPASPTPYNGAAALLPADFNQNPVNAGIDTRTAKLTTGYDRSLGWAKWSSTLSLTHTHVGTAIGFLDSGYASEVGMNAAGYEQSRSINDVFFDTHINQALAASADVTYGLNLLNGSLGIDSRQFDFLVPFDGAAPLASGAWATTDHTRLKDSRTFYGVYAQTRWKVTKDLSVLAGLRWNQTRDTRDSYGDAEGGDHETSSNKRLSGSVGANWWVWRDSNGDLDDVSLYVNFGNTFQPPQIDLGSDAQTGPILKPEFLQSTEVGAKADGLDGRVDLDLSAFFVNFNNRPLNTTINGQAAVVAGGQERFRGFELEANFKPFGDLKLTGEYALNRASYGDFNTQPDGGGAPVQLRGNRLELVPRQVASAGAVFDPRQGWHGSVSAQYVGQRYLDPLNQTSVSGFVRLDALAGYRWAKLDLRLLMENIGNRREPVLVSELGAGQLYLTNGRRVFATVSARID